MAQGFIGELVGLYLGSQKGESKSSVDSAELVINHGLRGDSHAGRDSRRQVSLFSEEVLHQLQNSGFNIAPEDLQANLLVEKIDLDSLSSGTQLRIGETVIEITEPRLPCRSITRIDNRLPKLLYGRCGQLAKIVQGGMVHMRDKVEVLHQR